MSTGGGGEQPGSGGAGGGQAATSPGGGGAGGGQAATPPGSGGAGGGQEAPPGGGGAGGGQAATSPGGGGAGGGQAATPPGGGGAGGGQAAPPGEGGAGGGQAATPGGGDAERGVAVQEMSDRYEGEFLNGLKHGGGKVTWTNGEFHEGSYYKDYRHGLGLYSWPSGHRFTGRFYLNRKEGYGHQLFPDGATFQGLYHVDQRFGPGVVTYADGRQDVGLWVGPRLLRLCSTLEEGFCLRNHPEYPAYVDLAAVTDSLTQPPVPSACESPAESDLLPEDNFIYPPGLETYSTNGDFLPLPPGRRRELDQIFYGELWEPDINLYQGYKHDPFSSLPLQARMQANIHRHRPLAESVSWDVAAVLSLTRKGFGPKGPLEVASEQLIQSASRGDLETVSQLLTEGLVYADVADSQGNTALMAAAINNHHEVIRLLLDKGVDIDKLNSDGMSALAVCHVLYFPLHSLNTAAVESPQVLMNPSSQIGRAAVDTLKLHKRAKGQERAVEVKEKTEEGAEGRRVQKEDKEVLEWSECGAEPEEDVQDEELPHEQTSVSARAVGSFTLRDTQETKRITAPTPHERHVHLDTLELLLERGSDPNKCKVPMPVLFLAIMAADSEVVSRLLLSGARTDITLPPEWKGLYPLHVAAALPGPAGLRITELLLCATTDPDAQACDQDDVHGPDKGTLIADEWRGGGRTALHVACQRNTIEVVSLLLSHKASTHLLWSGHSPLSLAIASGNEQVVEQLLRGGADPNITLGHGVGSALCAAVNINYHLCVNRTKLLHMLVEAGADILMPVMVGDVVGTAVDFAHDSFNKDMRIAHTPFHALNLRERETLIARRQLLSMMGDLLRRTAAWMEEEESLEREEQLTPNEPESVSTDGPVPSSAAPKHRTEKHSKPILKFCDHCGRSVSVKLAACSRCHKVSYCSMVCKLKAWEERHKDECFRAAVSGTGSKKKAGLKSPKGPGPLSDRMRPPLVTESILESQVRPKENYSCN